MRQPTGTAGTGIKYMLRYVYVAWHTSTCTPGCSGCPESCSSTLSSPSPFARSPWLMWAKKCSGVKNATLAVALPARMQLISLGQAQNIDHCRQLKRAERNLYWVRPTDRAAAAPASAAVAALDLINFEIFSLYAKYFASGAQSI